MPSSQNTLTNTAYTAPVNATYTAPINTAENASINTSNTAPFAIGYRAASRYPSR